MKQTEMFGDSRAPKRKIQKRDSETRQFQFWKILDLLLQGPKTNVDLARVCLNYTARISDLRHAGYVVECDRKSGLTTYRLVKDVSEDRREDG